MLSSGNSSLLDDEIRMRLASMKKIQDLLVIISEHLTQDIKINLHELEKYWNIEESTYFKMSIEKSREVSSTELSSWMPDDDKTLMMGLKFHHNIFSWTYKYIDLVGIYGDRIKIMETRLSN